MIDITFHVYEPNEWQKKLGWSVNLAKCCYSVYHKFASTHYQCTRNPKTKINEYGFCKQHTNMLLRKHKEEIKIKEWMMDITFYVYEPDDWKKRLGYSIDLTRCRYQVFSNDIGAYQCTRNPKTLIGKYGFCKQHTNMLLHEYGEEIEVKEWVEKETE